MRYPNHIIKTTITTNFSFKKLANNIENVLKGVSDDIGQEAGETAQQNINKAEYAPLTKYTKRMRRKGIGWGGKTVPKVTHDIPLRQTDALYNSLEYNKKTKSINMMAYGLKHQKGFENPKGGRVPKRSFLDFKNLYTGSGIGTQQQIIQNRINKTLKDKEKVYK